MVLIRQEFARAWIGPNGKPPDNPLLNPARPVGDIQHAPDAVPASDRRKPRNRQSPGTRRTAGIIPEPGRMPPVGQSRTGTLRAASVTSGPGRITGRPGMAQPPPRHVQTRWSETSMPGNITGGPGRHGTASVTSDRGRVMGDGPTIDPMSRLGRALDIYLNPPLICEGCGEEIINPYNNQTAYCNTNCRSRAYRKRKKLGR